MTSSSIQNCKLSIIGNIKEFIDIILDNKEYDIAKILMYDVWIECQKTIRYIQQVLWRFVWGVGCSGLNHDKLHSLWFVQI